MCRERALYAKSFYKNDYYLLDRPACHIPYAYACTIYHMCVSVCVCVPNSIASTGNSFCVFDIECIIDNPSFWPPLLKGTPVEPARSSPCLSFATSFLASFICAHATAYFNSPLSPPSPPLSLSLCPLYRRSTLNSSSSCACVCACASCYGKLVLNALLPPSSPSHSLSLSPMKLWHSSSHAL